MKAAIRAALNKKQVQHNRDAEHEMTLAALEHVEASERGDCEADSPTREEWLFRGKEPANIHPDVLKATADELIEAGWGWHERCLIPPNFRTQRPGKIDVTREKRGVEAFRIPRVAGLK